MKSNKKNSAKTETPKVEPVKAKSKVIIKTKFDDEAGRLGWKKLLVLVIIIAVVGGGVIFGWSSYMKNKGIEAKVVAYNSQTNIVTFKLLVGEEQDELMFGHPVVGLKVKVGDTIKVVADVQKGNTVTELVPAN